MGLKMIQFQSRDRPAVDLKPFNVKKNRPLLLRHKKNARIWHVRGLTLIICCVLFDNIDTLP